MTNHIAETLLKTIDYAIEHKIKHLNYDSTLLCRVVKIYSQENTYQLQYKDAFYDVTTKNISLALHDTVHLIIPEGNFANKYILEDAALNYLKKTS